MCLPHVINICCGHVIREFTDEELIEDSEDLDDSIICSETETSSLPQTYEEATKCDPIALGHSIVRVIRSSRQRRDAFQELILTGNEKLWFKVKKGPRSIEVQLEKLQLLRDVRTRWDSVYYMLCRLRELCPVSFL
jgi:hypothetical protein